MNPPHDGTSLLAYIRTCAFDLGFNALGVSGVELAADEARLLQWLDCGYHGEMQWMQDHGSRRTRPAELIAGTVSVISVRMDYWPAPARDPWQVLSDNELGYVSRYALGRDYHKVIRPRLQRLADAIERHIGEFRYRAFTDSAPVLEKPIARNAGLGWIGKHTNLIHRQAGSWFFLGELYTDLDLPRSTMQADHCGRCSACITACPTGAIVAPYQLDARLCISYLTIELKGSIPQALRPLIGNRIYGCDDCQLVCPWNRFATASKESDFSPRDGLDAPALIELMGWEREQFLARSAGTAIRRIGHDRFLRNVAVALGNAAPSEAARKALVRHLDHPSAMVREHVTWALAQQRLSKEHKPRDREIAPESS